jgi:hypothetical protein
MITDDDIKNAPMENKNKPKYISLGSDCSVSYQLRKYNLQSNGSMPFDWLRIDKIKSLKNILENDFKDFYNLSLFDKIPIKGIFSNFDKININSQVKLKHIIYNFIAPHEYSNNDLDIDEFKNKYERRIRRFRDISRNENIKKIYIRLENGYYNNELETNLYHILEQYGCKNFTIKFIYNTNYQYLIPDKTVFNWHRDYIPWEELL